MAIGLAATPLPELASVRLRLDSVVGYDVQLWDYTTKTAAQNAAELAPWVLSGGATMSAADGALVLSAGTVVDGSRYATRTLTGLLVGQRYTVSVWHRQGNGQVVHLGRGATEVRSATGPNASSADPGDGRGPTLLVYEFTAAATTEAVRVWVTGQTPASFTLLGIAVRNIPTQRLFMYQGAADAANWSQIGAAPANGQLYGPATSGAAIRAEYRVVTTGATVVYPAGHGIKRTLSGLIVGQRYRVNAAALGFRVAYGTDPTTPLRLRVGVEGIGASDPSTAAWLTFDFVATASTHTLTLVFADTFSVTYPATGQAPLGRLDDHGLYVEDLYASISDAYVLRSLTRGDSNGTRPVRLFEGQGLTDGVLITTDPEPALVGLVQYTAVVRDVVGGVDVTVNASATLEGAVTRSRIAPASLPSLGKWYDLAPGLTVGRETTTSVAQVINRRDPLVTLGAQTLRSGRLEVFADDYVMGSALEAVFNTGEVVLIRQPDHAGLDMYVVGVRTSLAIQPELTRPRRWVLEVEYVEVAPPTTPLRGSLGWTFAASSARNATFDASRKEFPTFLDLLIGPETT